ncbi:MAG: selenobiotic family peptide radical SAM maturase [Candidatus Omnitrophica bacterium]|nr:selenobiotic family peptide radical SAM maturase [Candidatus Omnitrophota bacterium]
MVMNKEHIKEKYPVCASFLGDEVLVDLVSDPDGEGDLSGNLAELASSGKFKRYIPQLAELEEAYYRVSRSDVAFPERVEDYRINPTAEIVRSSWKLTECVSAETGEVTGEPEKGEEWILLWKDPLEGTTTVKKADKGELLSVKIVAEGIDLKEAAREAGMYPGRIRSLLLDSAEKGILLRPESLLCRRIASGNDKQSLQKADTFTLQWHLTNVCDLRCRHCYDRTDRSPLSLEDAKRILADMDRFCGKNRVSGHVCFTGGNPFMYPHFHRVYAEAAERGFSTSILGNPVGEDELVKLNSVQVPEYFQVSLEGLEEHNDYMRGDGHFLRTLQFLDLLGRTGISSAVMLTLTADNINQVLQLAEELRDKTDYFTFNRLSQVGEGARIKLPGREEYMSFLRDYVRASEENPIMGFKDNLINIVLDEGTSGQFDGCTGYGCGAAFNFITVLPDGEAHACRKFPSPVGNVLQAGMDEVYRSSSAEKYRRGPEACSDCRLALLCRGCMASTYSFGMDVSKDRDPFCTMVP